jgi:NAD(P)H-hydrate epimerase
MTVIVEPLLDRAQSRDVDRVLASRGMNTALLMENAGRGASEHIAALARERGVRRVDVLCGPGNNGGDGLVVARHLLLRGLDVRVIALRDPAQWTGDAAIMRDALYASDPSAVIVRAEHCSIDAPLVVDALFGTGLRSALDEPTAALVRPLAGRCVVALDIPSGLDADTGRVVGTCVRAELTLTFAASKPGLHTGDGRVHAGEVRVVGLGATAPIARCDRWLVTGARVAPRSLEAHKGTAGRVLVIGGSAGTVGAGWLSALGAHRAGAGLVTFATRATITQPAVLETMTVALSQDATAMVEALRDHCAKSDCVVVGPGLGRDPWALSALEVALEYSRALVLDGDALSLLRETRAVTRTDRVIATPHPLEAARMLGVETADQINGDRVAAAREIAAKFRCVTVLKGAGTVIAHPSSSCWIVPIGEPTLAVAGSGDVLAGVVAARMADRERDADLWHEAAIEAVWAHARAGARLREKRHTARGALAHEIADEVARALESGE